MNSKRDISSLLVCSVVLAILYIFQEIDIWIKLFILIFGLIFVSIKAWNKYKTRNFNNFEIVLLGIALVLSVAIFLRSYLYL